MSILFSTEESSVINREINVDISKTDSAKIREKYDLSRCCEWIESNKFSRIALQFPDVLLPDSFDIANFIENETGSVIFVLGDTSYGSCCVDEIAAQHGSADALIHFGRACLSPNIRLPVLYIFGSKPINTQKAVEACVKFCKEKTETILLFYDVVYSHAIGEVAQILTAHFINVVVSQLDIPKNPGEFEDNLKRDNKEIRKCGRVFALPDDITLKDCYLFYVGEESLTQANLFLTFNSCNFFSFDPVREVANQDSIDINRTLGRRYYLVEKTKDAKIIGIIVGTLGVTHYLAIIKHIKGLIKSCGKRSYTLVFGKPNPAKLANFSEIDIFVLVACPENSLLESRDYFKPIITPFELEVALNKSRTWNGQYITNFAEILCGGSNYMAQEVWDVEVIDVSLISGKMRKMGPNNLEDTNESATTLDLRNSMTVAPIHQRGAGEQLAERSWKGLEQKLGETSVEIVKEGQQGLATSYNSEGR